MRGLHHNNLIVKLYKIAHYKTNHNRLTTIISVILLLFSVCKILFYRLIISFKIVLLTMGLVTTLFHVKQCKFKYLHSSSFIIYSLVKSINIVIND